MEGSSLDAIRCPILICMQKCLNFFWAWNLMVIEAKYKMCIAVIPKHLRTRLFDGTVRKPCLPLVLFPFIELSIYSTQIAINYHRNTACVCTGKSAYKQRVKGRPCTLFLVMLLEWSSPTCMVVPAWIQLLAFNTVIVGHTYYILLLVLLLL